MTFSVTYYLQLRIAKFFYCVSQVLLTNMKLVYWTL